MTGPRPWVLLAVPMGIALAWLILRRDGAASAPEGPVGGASRSSREGETERGDRTLALRGEEEWGAGPERRRPELPATDPRAANYTAATLYEVTQKHLQEIYADEPRVEPWAGKREQDVVDYSLDDLRELDPDVVVEANCRTSSCRIRVYSSNLFLTDEMADYPFACMARYSTGDLGMVDPGPPARRFADYYVIFGDENLDDRAFLDNRERTCPKYRASWKERIQKPFDADE